MTTLFQSNADAQKTAAEISDLRIHKMKMDRVFTVYLESCLLDPEQQGSAEWTAYRELMKLYADIERNITTREYKLKHYA